MTNTKNDLNDVVICSRIRLARNIADFPFVSTCSKQQLSDIETAVKGGLVDDDHLSQLSFLDSSDMEAIERQFLLDLDVIHKSKQNPRSDANQSTGQEFAGALAGEVSLEMASEDRATSLVNMSVVINEEDHLRMTVTRSDLDLGNAWEQIGHLDDMIESHFNFAFSPRWGYLTACPANVGTGMRVSVLVHLPALVLTEQTEKVFRSVQRVNVVARGMYGDNAAGDFFRISNQATLGCSETELIDQVASVIPTLVKCEREAREFLLKQNPEAIHNQVNAAMESLCRCDLTDRSEGNNKRVMSLLSKVRMGVGMEILDPTQVNRVNAMFSLVNLRHRLFAAVTREDYSQASKLRDQIRELESSAVGKGNVTDESPHDREDG